MLRERSSPLAKNVEAATSASGGLRRFDVESRHASQFAAVLAVVEGAAAVHRRAIVPDHEIADAPLVAVHELRLGRMLDEIPQQQPALGNGPVDDPGRV